MLKLKLSASLIALAVLVAPALSQDTGSTDDPAIDLQQDPSAEAPASADDAAAQRVDPSPAEDVAQEPAQGDSQAPETQIAAGPDPRFERKAAELLGDSEPRATLARPLLRKRIQLAQQLLQSGKLSPATAARLRQFVQADRAAFNALAGGAQPDQAGQNDQQANARPLKPRRPAVDAEPDQQPDQQPQVNRRPAQQNQQAAATSESEIAARDLLADRKPGSALDNRSLMQRLRASRAALSQRDISGQTRVQLRRRLEQDTQIIRARREEARRKAEAQREQAQNKGKSKTDISVSINLGAPAVVLSDRRPGDDLTTEELQHRIRIYRDVESSGDYVRYRQDERDYWRRTLTNDRELLRRRLLEEKHRREAEIAQEDQSGQLDREIIINVQPQRPDSFEDDVYVAEADDRQIEEVLVAPPRERIVKRYTVDEVANDRNVRRAVPRLELDTIHFGFGEALVREEEVRNLDRIGNVMERILKRYPREVFLIEGHTDAVGSDLSNLYLSRSRAEAVKQALMTYYDIPARNLRTAGLGERFLKIPTDSAEAENRRVSVSRITQFIGEAQ